jgi:gas vesicle protein
MSNDERNAGTSGVLLSFLLGALSGAALAILFAPRSGRETREILGEKLRETAERSRQLGERAVEKGKEVAEDASSLVDRGRDVLEKRRDRLAAAVEAGRQAFRDEKEKM